MSFISIMHKQGESSLPAPLLGLLALGAGLAVAPLYYSQPMLGVLGGELNATPSAIGLVPTVTQLGYAFGRSFVARDNPTRSQYTFHKIITGVNVAF